MFLTKLAISSHFKCLITIKKDVNFLKKKEFEIFAPNHLDKLIAFIEAQNIDVKGKLLHPAGRNT